MKGLRSMKILLACTKWTRRKVRNYGVIADVLLRLNLKLRGQCYNGAVSMSSGVGCMQAVFTHCTKFSLCRYH